MAQIATGELASGRAAGLSGDLGLKVEGLEGLGFGFRGYLGFGELWLSRMSKQAAQRDVCHFGTRCVTSGNSKALTAKQLLMFSGP